MSRLLDEARAGKRKIWYSTILYSELRPSLLTAGGFKNIEELIVELEGVLLPVSPTPPILMRAGRLRDYSFKHHSAQKTEKSRVLTVPDAIQFATCLFVKEALGITDIEFHTFDDGKGRNYEEKAVSLLRFEEYAEHCKDDLNIKAVCELARMKPALAQSNLT